MVETSLKPKQFSPALTVNCVIKGRYHWASFVVGECFISSVVYFSCRLVFVLKCWTLDLQIKCNRLLISDVLIL